MFVGRYITDADFQQFMDDRMDSDQIAHLTIAWGLFFGKTKLEVLGKMCEDFEAEHIQFLIENGCTDVKIVGRDNLLDSSRSGLYTVKVSRVEDGQLMLEDFSMQFTALPVA